jgi:RNA polymerase sigma-70 factor (ECF subfamily)
MEPPAADFLRCVGAFDAEFDYVHQVLRRQGVAPSDAEDLAQEVFLVMWRRWSQYDSRRAIRPWLAGIAFRVAYNHRQRAAREVPGGLLDLQDHRPDPEQAVAADNLRSLVWRVLSSMPEKHRFLLLTHDVDGVSVREIADTLAVPIPTAHTRLRAARLAFARAIKRQQAVSMTRARLAPLLHAFAQAERGAGEPAPAESRRRAVARVRRLALLPGFGLSAGDRSAPRTPAPALPRLPAGFGRAWLPVGGAAVLGGVGLLLALAVGDPAPPRSPALALAQAAPASARRPRVFSGGSPTFASVSSLPPPAEDPVEASIQLGKGLVGYWRFDEPGGSAATRDLSGNGNDCQLRRLDPRRAWTEGRLGRAIALDGQGWLECPRSEALARLGHELSISLWVRRTGAQQHVRALVSRQYGSAALDNFHLGFRDDELWMRTRFRGQVTRAPFPRQRNAWHHLAVTLDAHGRTRLFVDGAEVESRRRDGQPPLGGGDNPLLIGGGLNVPDLSQVSELFQGAVDELALYGRKLEAAEVRALAAAAQPPPFP